MNAIQLRDIALKTVRGQRGRVRQGKCAGGNSYGYDVLPGKVVGGNTEHGERAVNITQAAIIRRIFTEYAQGFSAKRIAERVNRERIPSPSGGHWSATTILGSRTRRTGIINNTAYIGEMVRNKSSYWKDPDSAKRLATINPEDILGHVTVPHMWIVDDVLWEAVRQRQGPKVEKGPGMQVCNHRRPKTLFSGLMRCGCCGAGCSKVSKTGFGCSAARNKGDAVCQNKRVIHQAEL